MKVNKLKSFFKVALASSMAFTLFSTNLMNASAKENTVEKTYTVPVKDLKSGAPIPAVTKAFAKAFGDEVQITEKVDGTKVAKIELQHMVVDMSAFGAGKYECNIQTVKDAKVLAKEARKLSPEFGHPDKVVDNEVPTLVELILPKKDKEGKYPIVLTVDFMDRFIGGGKPYETTVQLDLDEQNKTEIYANYSKIDELLKTIPTDLSKYTEASVKVLNDAKAGIVRDLNVAEQARVDEMAATLEKAIKGLEEIKNESAIQFENNAIYEVEVALYNADKDLPSMAASSLKKTAKIFVKNGKAEMHIYTQPMTMGTITASLQEIKIFDLDGKAFKNGVVVAKSADGNPIEFKFDLPHTEEFIKTEVNPHVAMMGNAFIPARIKVNYSTLKKVGEINTEETNKPSVEPETKPEVKPETNKPETNPTESNKTEIKDTKVPHTGVATNTLIYFAMAMVSAAAVVMIYRRTRKA